MALLQKSDVDAVSEEMVLSQMVQAFLIQEAKLFDKVINLTAPHGVDKLKIPKAGGFTVQDKAPTVAVTPQSLTYLTDDLSLDKHKVVQVNVEKFANIQAKVAIIQDIAMRVGKGLALQLDTDIIAALEATSAAAPDHRIVYTGNSGADIAGTDILEALRLLKVQNVPMGEIYMGINPSQEKKMLLLPDFIRADSYGASETALARGTLGKIYGVEVIVHNGFNDVKSIVWHKTHAAIGMQETPTFDSAKDLPNLADLYSWDMIYGTKTLDAGKRGVLLGSAA